MENYNFSISILVPTFNRPQKLDRLLNSIKLNNLENICRYEIRIYDNNSTKDYSKIISKYKGLNIIYKKHPSNLGQSQNFKLLQKDVLMEWFCIISDDDYVEDNHFKSLFELLTIYSESVFVCSHTKVKGVKGFYKSPSMKSKYWENSNFHYPTSKKVWQMYLNHFVSTGCIFNKKILKDIFFDENSDDRIFLTELSSLYPFCTSNKATAILTIGNDTTSSRGGARAHLSFTELLESLNKKIYQLNKLQKGEKKSILAFVYFFEYLFDLMKLFYSKNIFIRSPKFSFSFKYFLVKFVLISQSFFKYFLGAYFKIKKIVFEIKNLL